MRAQGTIEYLVILAVIVVISLVVVTLMVNSTAPAGQISETQSKIYWETQPIRIYEAAADSEGDAILSISPQETITIETLTIDGVEKNIPDTKVLGGNTQIILLTGLIPCTGGSVTYTINKISGTNENGLPVTISEAPIVIECTENISEESIIEENYVEPYALGSTENPIIINTCAELQDINSLPDSNYVLGQNINCDVAPFNTGDGFDPIGAVQIFSGSLKGNSYSIDGLFIDRAGAAALFSQNYGLVEDIILTNVDITGGQYVAGIAGQNYAQIVGSSVDGSIIGDSRVGGLVGYNSQTISESSSTADVTGNTLYGRTGGLVGYNVGGIWDSYAQGPVTGNGSVGGLIGQDYNYFGLGVKNSYATGLVTCSFSCGGLIGTYSTGPPTGVESSYWDYQTTTISGDPRDPLFVGTETSTANMKQQVTFVGWNFSEIWQICEGTSYPFLRREGRSC